MYKLKQLLRKGRVVVATAVLGFGIAAGVAVAESALPAQTQAASCDRVNILYCGLKGSNLSGYISSIKNYYNSNKSGHNASSSVNHHYNDVRKVFNYVGASGSEVRGMNTSNSKLGTLHRNGKIYVGGKLVATDAKVAARFSVPGAEKISGTNVWLRKTTSSFANDKVTVVVHFKYGKMDFAVIKDCGNIVTAKPKVSKGYCVDLDRAYLSREERRVKATVKGSTTNASIVDYKIDWGDGNTSNKKSDTHTYDEYGTFTIKGSVKVKYLSGKTKWDSSSKCESTVEFKKPKQTLECVELQAIPTDEKNQYRFVATAATTNGATISGYTFNPGDGSADIPVSTSSETAEAVHTYTADGDYTATVSVDGTVNGQTVTGVTSKACKTPVTITPDEVLACVDLTKEEVEGVKNSYVFQAVAQALNGATIASYTFDFGDGSDPVTVDSSSENADTTHTYESAGDYTATVTVNGTVNGEEVSVTDPACEVEVTVKPEQPELPKTGAASMLSLFGGISALGTVGHRLYLKRRLK